MRKLFVGFAITIAAFSANAQTQSGLQIGTNLGRLFGKTGSIVENSTIKVGVVFGVVADVNLGGKVYFRPELNFIQKGGKNTTTNTIAAATYTNQIDYKLSYIQLMPNFVFDINAGANKFFIGLGPELALGFEGNAKRENTTVTPGFVIVNSSNRKVKFDGKRNTTDDKLHLNTFDIGGNTIIGFKMANGAFISLSSTIGFLNLSPQDDYTLKSRSLNLKIGYMLGGAKSKNKK